MPQAYAVVAQTRARELRTRMVIAVVIGGAAFALAPSVLPFVWFAAMVAAQMLDWVVYRPFRIDPEAPQSRARRAACVLSAGVNTAVYSSIAAYFWFRGGEAGHIFAFVQVAGGLLHVTLHMHRVRPVLLSACLGHAVYFLGLPAADAMLSRETHPLGLAVVLVGCLLYGAHLVVAVGQTTAANRQLQEARDRADAERRRAERASDAKSDFLATVSHEIRTPMNAVIAAAHLLKRTELTPEQAEHVSMLEHAGGVLTGLLTDVLDISKIEAGKMQMQVSDLPLRAKLDALVALWRPRAQEKGVELKLTVGEDVPAAVRTDPLRFQQVLFNLVSNAVKFTDQGVVEVVAAVERGAGAPELVITVSDTGCGIAADALERVFEAFEQVGVRQGGTGLGLAISRRLAELLGGGLSASSTPGRGSSFRFATPLAAVETPALSSGAADEALPEGSALKVLVAEDHEVNRRIVALLLAPTGCVLTFAVDGEEAVRIAAAQAFDAILMDMQMPRMDGLEATLAIRSGGGPNVVTPVIALTANAMDHHRAAWAAVGVTRFLTKPIDAAALVAALFEAGASRARAA